MPFNTFLSSFTSCPVLVKTAKPTLKGTYEISILFSFLNGQSAFYLRKPD